MRGSETLACRPPNFLGCFYLELLGVRWEVAEMKQRREDESASERSVMDHALALSRNVFEAQVRVPVRDEDGFLCDSCWLRLRGQEL